MDDRRFIVNNLGNNAWLFFGEKETGKTGLASLITEGLVDVVDIYSQQVFLEYVNTPQFALKYIYVTTSEKVAEFIRKFYYSIPFRNAVNKIYKSGHKVNYALNDLRGW